MTVTGKTLAENLPDLPGLTAGQQIVHTAGRARSKRRGHIRILRGNLAPDGAVAKITGKEGSRSTGPAQVYDSRRRHAGRAREAQRSSRATVVVIRYEGPKGGPGMPEMLTPTSAIMGAGLGTDVALITDGRFWGGSHGFIVGHITPEAQEGGPIALVQNGDRHHRGRHGVSVARRGSGGRTRGTPHGLDGAGAEDHERRPRRIRAAGALGVRRLRHGPVAARRQGRTTDRTKEKGAAPEGTVPSCCIADSARGRFRPATDAARLERELPIRDADRHAVAFAELALEHPPRHGTQDAPLNRPLERPRAVSRIGRLR